ncbi:MAG TPA: hypothetical protein QGH10_13895 [Armatimonadota bacterium]|nr:hypothetical protein [Armatimonadota bacterium]
MKMTRLLIGCVAIAALGSAALGQAPVRELQMGTKTASGGYATTLDFELPVNDFANAGATIEEHVKLLDEVTRELGFTPTGTAHLELEISMEARPDGMVQAHIKFFIAEQPTDEELGDEFDIDVVQIGEEMVAYTYHKGGLDSMEQSFMKLMQWVFGQPLEMNGFPRIVANLGDDDFPIEVQMPVKPE